MSDEPRDSRTAVTLSQGTANMLQELCTLMGEESQTVGISRALLELEKKYKEEDIFDEQIKERQSQQYAVRFSRAEEKALASLMIRMRYYMVDDCVERVIVEMVDEYKRGQPVEVSQADENG